MTVNILSKGNKWNSRVNWLEWIMISKPLFSWKLIEQSLKRKILCNTGESKKESATFICYLRVTSELGGRAYSILHTACPKTALPYTTRSPLQGPTFVSKQFMQQFRSGQVPNFNGAIFPTGDKTLVITWDSKTVNGILIIKSTNSFSCI